MRYETLLIEKSGEMATVTLNRPDILNAMNVQVMLELRSYLMNSEETRRFALLYSLVPVRLSHVEPNLPKRRWMKGIPGLNWPMKDCGSYLDMISCTLWRIWNK